MPHSRSGSVHVRILPTLKGPGSRADAQVRMVSLPEMTWIGIGLVVVAAVLAMLHTLSTTIRNELLVHDLKVKAARLRDRKSTRLNSSHIQKSRMPSSA